MYLPSHRGSASTLMATTWLLEPLARPLKSFSRPTQTLSSLKIILFRPSNGRYKLSHGLISTLTVSSSTLTASKCQTLHLCQSLPVSYSFFGQIFGSIHYFSTFSSFFQTFSKKILNKYFSFIYKCSQVYYIIIYPLYVILMIRLACFVSQSSKCKNFRILFGEVAASLSAYVQF